MAINVVKINPITIYEDERGWLAECFRSDNINITPEMSYFSYTKYNEIRGPHKHIYQTDFFVFIGPGNFKLYLWDNQPRSKTRGKNIEIIVGESNPVSVIVPPQIVHGYKSISKSGSFSINYPNKLYKGVGKKR